MSEFTPWFPANMEPVRDGVYEFLDEHGTGPAFGYWSHGIWFCVGNTVADAQSSFARGLESMYQAADRVGRRAWMWRGLAKEPK